MDHKLSTSQQYFPCLPKKPKPRYSAVNNVNFRQWGCAKLYFFFL